MKTRRAAIRLGAAVVFALLCGLAACRVSPNGNFAPWGGTQTAVTVYSLRSNPDSMQFAGAGTTLTAGSYSLSHIQFGHSAVLNSSAGSYTLNTQVVAP